MIALARFIMAGPSKAILVASVAGLLALILPPLAWVSGAVVALVVLHLGPQRGMQVVVLSSVAAMAFSWFALGTPVPVFGIILLLWMPAWIAAMVLRNTVSLSVALQVITGMGVLFVLIVQMVFPQVEAQLTNEFSELVRQVIEQQPDATNKEQMVETMQTVLPLIPGVLAAGMMLSTVLSLFLGRWWQAALYNPGGFAKEFNQLRLGKILAAISTLLLVLAIITATNLLMMLVVVVLSIYLIQGFALIHGIVDGKQINKAWLFALYISVILLPHMVMLPLSVFGLTDAWIDFRRRLKLN